VETVGQLAGRRQVLDMINVDLNDVIAGLIKMVRRVLGEHIMLR